MTQNEELTTMKSNVSTKLIEHAGDKAFKARKAATIFAWRTWYPATIEAMAAHLKHEGMGEDDFVSGELGALQSELDHVVAVGGALFGFMHDRDNDCGDDNAASTNHIHIIDCLWHDCGWRRAFDSSQPSFGRPCSMRKRGPRPFRRSSISCSYWQHGRPRSADNLMCY
jgi:hypothetical protein